MKIPFTKMNGAGNDFVVIDARQRPLVLNSEQVWAIASRDNAVTEGCDQVIVMEPSQKADVFMRIYNADGGEVDACGNATRCVGWLVIKEHPEVRTPLIGLNNERLDAMWPGYQPVIQTKAGFLECHWNPGQGAAMYSRADANITANMGKPQFAWDKIPLSKECKDIMHLDISIDGLADAASVGMGNPHVIFFVDDVEKLELIESVGQQAQTHPLFDKHRVNVTIASVRKDDRIMSSVWERGVGRTGSCGTAACATAVAAIKRGYCRQSMNISISQNPDVSIELLDVRWDASSNDVFLTGPVQIEREGTLDV